LIEGGEQVSKRKKEVSKTRKQCRALVSISPIAAAVSAALLQASAAYADESDQTGELETVVVTGIRLSIENSIAIKRSSESIVEAVTAEDIGKLPDSSIAESIARLPGLTAQRVGGRAQVISIRGMAPDFAVTLMNGRELVSTGDNRGVEFDQYPSELISGVTVYKTPDAGLMAQGLSGTADLQTIRPLGQQGRTFAMNARLEKNSNGELNSGVSDRGERLSLAYVDQFFDKKIGLAIGFAHLNSPEQEQHFGAWWWGADAVGMPPPNELVPIPNTIALLGAEVTAASSKQKRDALMAVVEYQPNENFRSSVDLYYSKFDQEYTMRGLLWESGGLAWGDGTAFINPVIEPIPGTDLSMATGGTMTGINPVVQSNFNTRQDKLFTLGWNNRLNLDEWTLVSDLSYSQVNRKEQTVETYVGLGNYFDVPDNNFQFNSPIGTNVPQFTPGYNYADPAIIKLSDPGGWGQDAFMRRPTVDDQLATLKLSAKRELSGIFSEIETGIGYTDRSKTHHDHDFQYFLQNGGAPVFVSSDLLTAPTSLAWAGIPGVLAYDVLGVLNKYYDPPVGEDVTQPAIWKRNYTITEKASTMLGKLNINTHLGRVPVRGNLGLQVIRTNQSSIGNANTDRSVILERGTSYNDVLPSLNLNFDLHELSKDLYIRFGAAKTMARPRMDDLKAGINASVGTTPAVWSGDGGNPNLRPWRADAYDLSAEKYFGKSSYVAVAGFYKKLKSYIYNQPTLFDFTGFPNTSGNTPDSPIGVLNTPVNGEGGKVQGVELSASFEGGLLTDALDGFGILGSISKTSSSIKPSGPGTNDKLPGLSGTVSNLTVFYEKHGFSTRISRRFRSAFRAEALGPHGDRVSTEIMAEKLLDFQASYEFDMGKAKGLSLVFQVNNLRNEPYRTRYIGGLDGNLDAPEQFNAYGRQILFGVNYKL
jgi:iron complex outermembrane receptor protein